MINIPAIGELGVTWNPGMIKVSEPFELNYDDLGVLGGDQSGEAVVATIKQDFPVLILGFIVNVTQVFDAGDAITLGVAGALDEFMTNAEIVPDAPGLVVHWAPDLGYDEAVYFDADDPIEILADYTDSVAPSITGNVTFQIIYVEMANIA